MLVANDMPMDRCSVRHTGLGWAQGTSFSFSMSLIPLWELELPLIGLTCKSARCLLVQKHGAYGTAVDIGFRVY